MKRWFWIFVVVGLLCYAPLHATEFMEHDFPWVVIVALLGTIALWKIKIPPLFKILPTYLLLNCIASSFWMSYSPAQDTIVKVTLQLYSLEALSFLAAFFVFLELKIDLTKGLKVAAYIQLGAMLVEFIGMRFAHLSRPQDAVFFLKNPSMAATFVVLALSASPWALLAVSLTHSWVAGLVGVVSCLWRFKRVIPRVAWIAGGASALGVLLLCHIPDNGRFENWEMFWRFWMTAPWYNQVFGMGLGTTRIWLPWMDFQNFHATHSEGIMSYSWWIHGDWTQALYELGWFGLALLLPTVLLLFWKANDFQRGRILAFSTSMLFNMPVHWLMTALIGWQLVSDIVIKKGAEKSPSPPQIKQRTN